MYLWTDSKTRFFRVGFHYFAEPQANTNLREAPIIPDDYVTFKSRIFMLRLKHGETTMVYFRYLHDAT